MKLALTSILLALLGCSDPHCTLSESVITCPDGSTFNVPGGVEGKPGPQGKEGPTGQPGANGTDGKDGGRGETGAQGDPLQVPHPELLASGCVAVPTTGLYARKGSGEAPKADFYTSEADCVAGDNRYARLTDTRDTLVYEDHVLIMYVFNSEARSGHLIILPLQ